MATGTRTKRETQGGEERDGEKVIERGLECAVAAPAAAGAPEISLCRQENSGDA